MPKNLVSGPILAPLALKKKLLWILPLPDAGNYCKLSLYAVSRKTNEPNQTWENCKNLVLGLILAQIRAAIFFFFFFSKTWLPQSLDVRVSYHHHIRKKLSIQSWEKLVTDGRTDRRTRMISLRLMSSVQHRWNWKILFWPHKPHIKNKFSKSWWNW